VHEISSHTPTSRACSRQLSLTFLPDFRRMKFDEITEQSRIPPYCARCHCFLGNRPGAKFHGSQEIVGYCRETTLTVQPARRSTLGNHAHNSICRCSTGVEQFAIQSLQPPRHSSGQVMYWSLTSLNKTSSISVFTF